ncbi:putative ribonuclease H-like domain-containing protein [Tanacetum coccineum]
MYSFDIKNIVPKESLTCLVAKATSNESMLWHRRLGHINFKNINKLVKDNLVRGLPTKHFENDQTCVACLKGKQHRASCKFDAKVIKFLCWISLSSKALGITTAKTRRVEENLHIGFLENKPMIEGNGPKWLFDIDSLTQSMNYVPVAAGTISNESAGTQGELNAGTSTQKEEISQDCIVMPIWKDASYFDSPSKDVGNGEPKSAADDQKQVEDGPHNESDEKDKSKDDSSPKEVNAAGQHVNTASPEVNTGRFKLNTVDPSVNTASSYDPDSPKDMFKLGASHTLEATHVEFFSDEDEPEVDLGNITNSYTVPTTPNTRIHKDHPIKNVIGDVKSSIQTRRMTKSTSEQGFLSAVYEEKTHDTLNTCLYACFLSQIEPTSIAKALSDSSWVEAMQEELLQFKLQQVWKLMDLPNGRGHWNTNGITDKKKVLEANEEALSPVARNEANNQIQYALIKNPKIYVSLIQQFWGTTTARTTDDGEVEITASIDGQVKTITEASLRRHLKLEDSDGITSLPNTEIFEQLALMGYVSDSARLTFQKGHFSPQWRVDFPLFPTMITTPESSPSRITSSPSLSPQTHQSSPLRDITRQASEIPQS